MRGKESYTIMEVKYNFNKEKNESKNERIK